MTSPSLVHRKLSDPPGLIFLGLKDRLPRQAWKSCMHLKAKRDILMSEIQMRRKNEYPFAFYGGYLSRNPNILNFHFNQIKETEINFQMFNLSSHLTPYCRDRYMLRCVWRIAHDLVRYLRLSYAAWMDADDDGLVPITFYYFSKCGTWCSNQLKLL